MKKCIATLVCILALSVAGNAQAKELVVAVFGGAYTDMVKAHVGEFEKANNVTVRFVPASGADGLAKAMAKEVDVVHGDMVWAMRGEFQNAFEALDPALVPNRAELFPRALVSDYTTITNFGQYGIAYNPKLANPAPTSWLDLWKPEYKGRITTAGFDAANLEILILMARLNGGDENNLDPGFAKMAELGRNITVFYNQHAQLLDLFRHEDVVMARWLRGRVDWARTQGVELQFAVPQEGAVGFVSTVHVVRGTENRELAMKFVNHLLSAESQIDYARVLGYTPARAGLDLSGIDVPYGAEMVDSLLISDWRILVPRMDELKERWEKEVAR